MTTQNEYMSVTGSVVGIDTDGRLHVFYVGHSYDKDPVLLDRGSSGRTPDTGHDPDAGGRPHVFRNGHVIQA